MTIIRPTTINARFSQPVGLGGEKLWLCPTLGGDRLDLSGNGNHGTYNGGMGTVADKYKGSRAYDFTGTSKRIALGTSLNDAFYGDHSYSAWVRISGDIFNAEPAPTIVGSTNTSGTWVEFSYGKTLGSLLGGVTTFADDGASNGSAIVSGVPEYWLETNDWYHISAVRDYSSNNVHFYLDGLLTHIVPFVGNPITSMTQDLFIGYSGRLGYAGNTSSSGVKIYYDDIRVYDRTLGAGEVKHLASYRGVLGSPRQPYDPLKRTVVRVPAAIPAATKVGSFKKPKTIIKPSYQAGYARNASESENPKLWDGLVGAWMPSFGVTGETLRDVSGNGNHGTLVWDGISGMNPADAWGAGEKGTHLTFDGGNDEVLLNKKMTDLVDSGSPITLSALFKTQKSGIQIMVGNGSSNRCYIAIGVSNGLSAYWGFGSIQNSASTNAQIGYGWHFYAATYDGSTATGYLDGVKTDERVIGTQSFATTSNVSIGRSVPSFPFQGNLGAARIYNRALSPQEIKQLYVDSLAPFRKKQRVSVAVPAAVPPSATYHPLRSLAHPLEQ